jgi:predicted Zn-dependent protease
MGLLSLAFALTTTLAAGDARAKPPAPKADKKVDKKAEKKRLEIERHEWMAQYYIMRANDYAGAAKEYQAILVLAPDNERAALALATLLSRDKKEKQALEVLGKLTKKNPKSADAWIATAQIQLGTGDDKGMKASVASALAVDPRNVSAYYLLFEGAQRRRAKGDPAAKQEALDAAHKLTEVSPNKTNPIYKLAERAVVELGGQPIDLTVYDAKAAFAAAFEAGLFASINQKMAIARRGFEQCTAAAPRNEECHYYLGLIHGSVTGSEAYDLKQALTELALAPSMPAAWVEQARILRASDKNEEARAALGKALALDPRLAVAHLELGIIEKIDGKTEAAVAQFAAAIDADRLGAVGERALTELSKIDPTNALVTEGMLADRGGDVFSTEQYKSLVDVIERQFGGVVPDAPERPVVEEIVRRLAEGSAVKQEFKVQVVGSRIVNAFALADGRVYVTRGLLDLVPKPVDANNDILGHVLAHELNHVIHKHTLHSAVFQQAMRESSSMMLDPSILTHVSRLHEIEADREGLVMAFLAGYRPRGGIEFMELMGKEREIPKHLDHPTFQERIDYLTDYWTNDVQYAFVSFKLGVAEMDRGAGLEATDMGQAATAYRAAVEHFKRFHTMLPSLKEAMNDLGIAYAKLGVFAMSNSPLGRWQTRFSVERDTAVKYVGLASDEGAAHTRGGDKERLPHELREAIGWFKEALATDEDYSRARLNLAAAYLAANQLDNTNAMLAKVQPKGDVTAADVDLIRGVALAEAKSYDGARAAFGRALAAPAAKRAAAYNLARTLELAGKKPEAKQAYQQYVKAFPGGPWAQAAQNAAAKM